MSPWHDASSGCGWRTRLPDMEGSWEYVEQAIADSQHGVVVQFGGSGIRLTTPHHKKCIMLPNISKHLAHEIQPKQWKKDMRYGTWNVKSFCRVGAIKSLVGRIREV
jgi:hypothetical protein